MSGHAKSEPPKTKTPLYVVPRLVLLVVVIAVLCWYVWDIEDGLLIALPIIVALLVVPLYLKNVKAYTVALVEDYFTGTQRVIRQGLYWMAPGESITKVIDLRRHLHDVPQETYPSKAGKLLARYVYNILPNASTDESIIRYGSFEEDSIKQAARAMISMALSDHFRNIGDAENEDWMNKYEINKGLFGNEETGNTPLVKEFEHDYGVDAHGIRLEDLDFDKKVQDMRDTVSAARSFRQGVDALMKGSEGSEGMSREAAEKTMRLLGIANANEHIITLDAKGLENLRDVNIGWVPGMGSKSNKTPPGDKK